MAKKRLQYLLPSFVNIQTLLIVAQTLKFFLALVLFQQTIYVSIWQYRLMQSSKISVDSFRYVVHFDYTDIYKFVFLNCLSQIALEAEFED